MHSASPPLCDATPSSALEGLSRMDSAAAERLGRALQVRLRKLALQCLTYLDMTDERTLPVVLCLRSLIDSFEASHQVDVSRASSGKQWQRLRLVISDVQQSGHGLASPHESADFVDGSVQEQQTVLCQHDSPWSGCVKCNAHKLKVCPHGKRRHLCRVCPACPHGKILRHCFECFGCSHGKLTHNCAVCSRCPHGKIRHNCRDCRACPHGKLKKICLVCSPCLHGQVVLMEG